MKLETMIMSKNSKKLENGFGGDGPWLLLKCFYNQDGEYGEFFFNLNQETGEAEIVSKDKSFASALLAGLEKELR